MESLLREGANVGLVARGQVQLEQTVDELREQYGEERVVGWPTDCADDFLKEVSARIPMERLAKANEYQGALLFLLSEASAYLNGAILPMDGGRCVW